MARISDRSEALRHCLPDNRRQYYGLLGTAWTAIPSAKSGAETCDRERGPRAADIAVQTQALSASLTGQPSDPYEGDAYILPVSATGADWGGQAEGVIAAYQDGAWRFITPHEGWVVRVADAGHLLVRSAAGWVSLASAGGAPASFGINTSPEPRTG